MDMTNDTIIFKNSLTTRTTRTKSNYTPRPVYEFRLKTLAPHIKDQINKHNLSVDDIALALGMSHKQVQGHLRGSNGLKSPEQYEKVMKLCLEAKAQGVSVLDMMTTPGETPTGQTRKLPAYKPTGLTLTGPTGPEGPAGLPGKGIIIPQEIIVERLDYVLGTCLFLLGGIVGAFLYSIYT
jgi:hypothetical protein